ncbi:hypothetical protein [Pseudaquabacterium pictum]|uniref:Uncharacterized protein n=1 Tax=Pseudaquabacterium pictum TaxID=2315236 RepID=A0A480AYS4_9BURK|nr:hypothetical protein [Rubrivivax pictus]GCL66120.1 hypothetical protein AQPW35_52010 [Rubrivivax pictus]
MVLAAALVLAVPAVQAAADCLRDTREVKLGGSNDPPVRLRQYLCERDAGVRVSVQFLRLSDQVAAGLLAGRMPAALHPVLGNARVVRNPVAEEFLRLTQAHGISLSADGMGGYASLSSTTQEITSAQMAGAEIPTVTGLLAPENPPVDFPDPQALAGLTSPAAVPTGYRTISEEFIWRYMTLDDLERYADKVAEYNKLIVGPRFGNQFTGFRTGTPPREIRLYRELARGGWPSDFIVIKGRRDVAPSCGFTKWWDFSYWPREPVMDVVVVENRGQRPLAVDALLGVMGGAQRLRPTPLDAAATPQQAVTGALGTLDPGRRAIVPVRLSWLVGDGQREAFADAKTGVPSTRAYHWGPEIAVAGLSINGKPLTLEGSAASFLSMTMSSGAGSCPVLERWDTVARRWIDTGKVIDKANGADREATETRQFAGFVGRFRLIEHEAEIATIRRVGLRLVLKDGTEIDALTRVALPASARQDAQPSPVRLAMGESMELRFDLPPGVAARQVAASRLSVTGHYDRYADLLAGAQSQRSSVRLALASLRSRSDEAMAHACLGP